MSDSLRDKRMRSETQISEQLDERLNNNIQSTPGFGELCVLRDFISKIGVHLNRGTHRYVNNQ